VLHVVGVAGAVDVRVRAASRFVLHVLDGDGDAALLFLRSAIELVDREPLASVERGHHVGDGGGERGLAVVDVTDGADVEVLLAHDFLPGCAPGRRVKKKKPPRGAWPRGGRVERRALYSLLRSQAGQSPATPTMSSRTL